MSVTIAEMATEAAEGIESPKARKERKRAARRERAAKIISELKAKLAGNDAKLVERSEALSLAADEMRSHVDEMIAAAFDPSTPEKILSALSSASSVGRMTRFDIVRLQAAYVQGLIHSTILERKATVDADDKDRGQKIRDGVEECKLAAAKALGIYRKIASKQSADDAKKLSTKARDAVTRLAQAGKLFERFAWVRPLADANNRELGSVFCSILAPFASFSVKNDGAWSVVHPLRQQSQDEKAKRNGNTASLTPDEETALRCIVTSFAIGDTNESEFKAELVKAGFRKAPSKRTAQTGNGATDESADDGEGSASGKGSPMSVDYAALGVNATADEAKAFVVSWFAENAAKNKAGAIGILTALEKMAATL